MKLLNKIFGKKKEPIILKGYYTGTIQLNENESNSSNDYDYVVHVSELERYKDNLSKIKLENVEIKSGMNINQFNWIKTCVREQFVSIYETNKIQWLENISTLNDERAEKLKQIKKSK